jgi:hypothetical protein
VVNALCAGHGSTSARGRVAACRVTQGKINDIPFAAQAANVSFDAKVVGDLTFYVYQPQEKMRVLQLTT